MPNIRGLSMGNMVSGAVRYSKMRLTEKLHPFKPPVGGKFSKSGLLMDEDGYVMAMHEPMAVHFAQKFSGEHLVEICSGAGSMTVQFGKFSGRVSTIDMDIYRAKRCIPHNAAIYGVRDKVSAIWGNGLDEGLLRSLAPVDAVFADPDWLLDDPPRDFPIAYTQPSIPAVFEKVNRLLTPNIAIRMVKTTMIEDVLKLGPCKIEYVFWDNKLKFLMTSFGRFASEQGKFETRFSSQKGFLSSLPIR
jgi:hypothetical protein